MSLVKKLTEEELAIVEILRHPVWCGELIHEYVVTQDGEAWEYADYQLEFLCDFNSFVSIVAGRAIGKTVSLIDKLVWYCLNLFWDETIVYTVPNRVHLEPVFLRLTRWFRAHPLLQYYTGRGGINSQSFTIKLLNGAVIDCRIAGQSGTGANVIGLHVPIIILDESGYYPFLTFTELQPALNTFQQGFQMILSGVPSGLREKNVLFFGDMIDEKYTRHRIPAHRNPRYTGADEQRNLKQYGGKESEDYIHLVLGRHGEAAYNMFDRARMLIKNYDIFRATLYGNKLREDPTYLSRLYNALPPLPKCATKILFGIDLGYVEPTVIMVFYKSAEDKAWKWLVRLTLKQVSYPTQEKIIDYLDSLYMPGIIGIDEGSAGKAVVQHFMVDQKYRHKDFKTRMFPIAFRSSITIDIDENGEEIQVRAKQFGMQLLQSRVNNHEFCFSMKDEPVITELERTIYTKTAFGEMVFKTKSVRGGLRRGEDHNLAAMLCATLAQYLAEDVNSFTGRKVKLFRPRWR